MKAVAVCSAFALALGSASATGEPLADLSYLPCDDDHAVTFTVDEARVNASGLVRYSTRLYHLDGVPQLPAPTLVMQPGQHCNLTLHNDLAYQADCPYHANTMHCQSVTNVHTHGLHVAPQHDKIDVTLNGGQNHTYTYDMPANHQMGTHWYHAHHHGTTFLHVLGGMAGMLLVDQGAQTLPDDIAALYDNSVDMVLMHHFFGDSDADVGDEPFSAYSYPDLAQNYANVEDVLIEPDVEYFSDVTEWYSANGQYQPVVALDTNNPTVFRIVHAGGVRVLEMEMGDGPGTCTMTLLARDGVFQQLPYLELGANVMLTGTRADVSITCDTAGTYTVVSNPDTSRDDYLGTANRVTQDLFTLEVTDTSDALRDEPTSAVEFPDYLQRIIDYDDDDVSEGEYGLDEIDFRAGGEGEAEINDIAFTGWEAVDDSKPDYLEKFCVDEVYDLHLAGAAAAPSVATTTAAPATRRLMQPGGGPGGGGGGGDTSVHTLHIHINHMYVTNSYDADTDIIREGEFRDVIPASGDGTDFRMGMDDFEGDLVLHCHFLQHEDWGMFNVFEVEGADVCTPGEPDDDDDDSTLSPASQAAPSWTAVAGLGALALAWFR